MSFIKKTLKKELEPKINEFKTQLDDFIDKCSDDNILNKMFTEIYLLRIELDKKDGFIQNVKDYIKRNKVYDKKALIKLQFEDIIDNYYNYEKDQLNRFNEIMSIILPNNNKAKNILKEIWENICKAIDVMG